jgi:hypothetical protein
MEIEGLAGRCREAKHERGGEEILHRGNSLSGSVVGFRGRYRERRFAANRRQPLQQHDKNPPPLSQYRRQQFPVEKQDWRSDELFRIQGVAWDRNEAAAQAADPVQFGPYRLRGVGKTVLLETFKPLAQGAGWLWCGTDLSESASVTEQTMAIRISADVALVTSSLIVGALQPVNHTMRRGAIDATANNPKAIAISSFMVLR